MVGVLVCDTTYLGELFFKDGLAFAGGCELIAKFDELAGHGGFGLQLDTVFLDELGHVVFGLSKLMLRWLLRPGCRMQRDRHGGDTPPHLSSQGHHLAVVQHLGQHECCGCCGTRSCHARHNLTTHGKGHGVVCTKFRGVACGPQLERCMVVAS